MSNQRRHPNVVNRDEVVATRRKQGKYDSMSHQLGAAAGNRQLGANVMELPPGAVSVPFHFHCLNEESIYVISGTGIARIGDQRVPVRAGDWIAYPVGPETAHQMINNSDAPLVYLSLSTNHKAEVCGYPDSNKLLALGGDLKQPWIKQVNRIGEGLDYWDGEPDAK
jgi:uncharacterized cupin superfamily protein